MDAKKEKKFPTGEEQEKEALDQQKRRK